MAIPTAFSNLVTPYNQVAGAVPIAGIYLGNPPDGFLNFVEPNDNNVSWGSTQFGVGTFEVAPVAFPHIAAVSAIDLLLAQTYSATNAGSSQAQSLSISLGIYSLNGSSLSLISSFTNSTLCSVTGSTSSVSFNGVKAWPQTINPPMVVVPGNYWIALGSSTASAGNAIAAAISNCIYSFAGNQSIYRGVWGSSSFASAQYRLGAGFLSVTSASVPVSIALSDISGAVGNTGIPVVNFKNVSA